MSVLVLGLGFSVIANGQWREAEPIPREGRANILALSENVWPQSVRQGRLHAQLYPVSVTGVLPPERPIKNLFQSLRENAFAPLFRWIFRSQMPFIDFAGFLNWLGLHPYPLATDHGVYSVPYPDDRRPDYPMGYRTLERNQALGFTFGCAECHSSRLFGKTILGLSNRFPRANETFHKILQAKPFYNEGAFRSLTWPSRSERDLLDDSLVALNRIAAKKPAQLGLDTSLAQVSLSLSKRSLDGWASPSEEFEQRPRRNPLNREIADSKPAVWWNAKYKNRWLLDGSVVSGNPILTNLLWNEIGRGTDLRHLNEWLEANSQTVADLTAAVFASLAPRWEDFFSESSVDVPKARRGEILFARTCSRCHGQYTKGWQTTSEWPQNIQTARVLYHEQTPVVNVDTDPLRFLGMQNLMALNDLAISRQNGILIRPQQGYVPPPLVGIWARFPYFHNNSVPTLCDVLTPQEERPQTYWAREVQTTADFDANCVGYPRSAPKTHHASTHRKQELLFDTRRKGLSRAGHDEGIFRRHGQDLLTSSEKMEIIEFLKTL